MPSVNRFQWEGGPAIPQNFSLPLPIIRYMIMNPSSPEVYRKLIQTCKWFFEQNPMLVADHLNGKELCSEFRRNVAVDINAVGKRIWITEALTLVNAQNGPDTVASSFKAFCQKAFRPKLGKITLKSNAAFTYEVLMHESVSFEDLMHVANTAIVVDLDVPIVSDTGNVPLLEEIFGGFERIKKLSFVCQPGMCNHLTMKKMIGLENLGQLRGFFLYKLSIDTDVDLLWKFILKIRHSRQFWMFAPLPSHAEEYRNRLDRLVDDIIRDTDLHCCVFYTGVERVKAEYMRQYFLS